MSRRLPAHAAGFPSRRSPSVPVRENNRFTAGASAPLTPKQAPAFRARNRASRSTTSRRSHRRTPG